MGLPCGGVGAPKAAFSQKPKASASSGKISPSAVTVLIGASGSSVAEQFEFSSGCSAPSEVLAKMWVSCWRAAFHRWSRTQALSAPAPPGLVPCSSPMIGWVSQPVGRGMRHHRMRGLQAGRARPADRPGAAASTSRRGRRCAVDRERSSDADQRVEVSVTVGALHDRLDLGAVLIVVGERTASLPSAAIAGSASHWSVRAGHVAAGSGRQPRAACAARRGWFREGSWRT